SWANTQCWEIVVVKDPAMKAALQETLAKGNPATKAVVDAPVLLTICGKLNSSGYYKDQVTTKFG
ncbi:MAG TPA: nitroreductase, partial [Syntrophobacteraceae bacterium]|nr:nitroreductase [Syntrophobacteraceae bacterium]